MTASDTTAFVGSNPVNYDRHLGPLLFHHYADDLAARLSATSELRVLETDHPVRCALRAIVFTARRPAS